MYPACLSRSCSVETLLWKDAVVLYELAPSPRYPVVSLSVDHIEEGLNLPTLIFSQQYPRMLFSITRRSKLHSIRLVERFELNQPLSKLISNAIKVLNNVVPSTHINLGTSWQLKNKSTVMCHSNSFLVEV